jgi:putative ABC transport system permease protein
VINNYLKVAWRNIVRQKSYSFISIFGLAVGLACSIIVLLWVEDEFSFDQFHKNINQLYQVSTNYKTGDGAINIPGAPPAVAPTLKNEYPEVLNSARLSLKDFDFSVRFGAKIFTEKIRMADASLFAMFSFPLIKGDISLLQSDRWSIFMTEALAEKYFGQDDPIGKTVTLDNRYDFKVAGILKNIPSNSTLHFDFLVPLEFYNIYLEKGYLNNWTECRFLTFIQLHLGTPAAIFGKKISDLVKKANPQSYTSSSISLFLWPVSRLHLYSFSRRLARIWTVYIFLIIALLILGASCINFMILSIAQAGKRAKEIGIRKAVGASCSDLIWQFIGESMFLALLALLCSIILVTIFLPTFSSLSGKELQLNLLAKGVSLKILAIGLFVGLLAGSYPAFFLSSLKSRQSLQNYFSVHNHNSWLRKGLVVSQFCVSTILIIGTIVISRQYHFLRTMSLGINTDKVVYLKLTDSLRQTAEALKTELQRYPGVQQITRASGHPSEGGAAMGDGWYWEGKNTAANPWVTFLNVDPDFARTFQIKMVTGTFFPKDMEADTRKVIINETYAKIMGNDSPVGKRLYVKEENQLYEYTIIGVIKDFHYATLAEPISPMIISCNWQIYQQYKYLFFKLNSDDIPATIAYIERIFKKINSGSSFESYFLDESIEKLYQNEKLLSRIFFYFALLAIFISSLGLFGLSLFMAEQRTKEIGIRKTLGASTGRIAMLLSREFIKLVILANIITWPFAWYIMSQLLKPFAYRITMGIDIFIISGLITLLITVLTIDSQIIRAARANPVDSLRYE